MADEIEPVQRSGSNHGLAEIRTFFRGEYKVWSEEESKNQREEEDSPVEKETYREVSQPDPPAHPLHGFEVEVLALKNLLLDQEDADKFKAMAIVGVTGVGKTALCQKVFKDEDVKECYVPKIWVHMYVEDRGGENPKVAIVRRILENLGVDEEIIAETELPRLLYALNLYLWGKKYLIVLDDARLSDGWNERLDGIKTEGKKWSDDLSCGFPKGSGGRVIFTSRSEELVKTLVGEENLLHLLPRSDPEICWKIYMDAAKDKGIEVEPKNLEKCKEDLMNKCGGLPLAARRMGEMKTKP